MRRDLIRGLSRRGPGIETSDRRRDRDREIDKDRDRDRDRDRAGEWVRLLQPICCIRRVVPAAANLNAGPPPTHSILLLGAGVVALVWVAWVKWLWVWYRDTAVE